MLTRWRARRGGNPKEREPVRAAANLTVGTRLPDNDRHGGGDGACGTRPRELRLHRGAEGLEISQVPVR